MATTTYRRIAWVGLGVAALVSFDPPRPAAAQQALPHGVTAEMVRQGDPIFHGPGRCAKCHGANAKGTDRAPDLTSGKWIDIRGGYDEIVRVVTDGIPKPKEHPRPMPSREISKLSDAQVRAVAAYVWSLSHAK